eukprot:Awhi_evm1s10843
MMFQQSIFALLTAVACSAPTQQFTTLQNSFGYNICQNGKYLEWNHDCTPANKVQFIENYFEEGLATQLQTPNDTCLNIVSNTNTFPTLELGNCEHPGSFAIKGKTLEVVNIDFAVCKDEAGGFIRCPKAAGNAVCLGEDEGYLALRPCESQNQPLIKFYPPSVVHTPKPQEPVVIQGSGPTTIENEFGYVVCKNGEYFEWNHKENCEQVVEFIENYFIEGSETQLQTANDKCLTIVDKPDSFPQLALGDCQHPGLFIPKGNQLEVTNINFGICGSIADGYERCTKSQGKAVCVSNDEGYASLRPCSDNYVAKLNPNAN